MNKNCLFCEHFQISYEADYSDITPGDGMEVGCLKYYWRFDEFKDSEKDFRLHMLTAETCPDYQKAID